MTTREQWKAKTDRLERARIKAEEFVAAGGDLKSEEAVPLGLEMINACNEVTTLFGHPILKPIGEGKISPGAYLQQQITERSRKVAKSNNAAGYVAMWPEAVKEVLARFPNLSPSEKAALRGTVEGQIHSMGSRTHQDFTAALQAVARILGS
jgi:hypothetical protein